MFSSIGYCIHNSLVGSQWIIEDKYMTYQKLLEIISDKDFALFISKFKYVKLPFIFRSKSINFKKWNDIPDNFRVRYLNEINRAMILSLLHGNISEEYLSEMPIITKQGIEIKDLKYFYLPIVNEKFIAIIYLYKFYDDRIRGKTTYSVLVTFDKNGKPIANLKISEATIHYSQKDKKTYELYTITKIDKDYNIEYKEIFWHYIGDGYSTSGFGMPVKYKILGNGKIVKIESDKEKKIKRDE